MPEKYTDAILKYLSGREYQPLKPRQLARRLGIAEQEYGTFREAIKQLRDQGRVVMGEKNAVTLPEIGSRVIGSFRKHQRGFGFVIPEMPNAHGDLFIPPDNTSDAVTGDIVEAKVYRERKKGRQTYAGSIVRVIRRGQNRFVGTLEVSDGLWFVMPEGVKMTTPIGVRDVGETEPGTKVVVEIIDYASGGGIHHGVIVERLGQEGELAVETQGVIRSHGLRDEFAEEVFDEARSVTAEFDAAERDGRDDLTGETILTIDPPDAKDFDDAISLVDHGDGTCTLGVHIADVSHFVRADGALDLEARERATSVYFPRRVVPMLPEILSNGVCSLQEGVDRFAKTVWITYDENAKVTSRRYAETVIRSAKRLTYHQAQAICDGKDKGEYREKVVDLVRRMEALARRIEKRRWKQGMLELDLPEVELDVNAAGEITDVREEQEVYSHKIIEMFMVEANEAVAELMFRLDRPVLRRIHPEPDQLSSQQLRTFVQACGAKLPAKISRKDIQALLESVKGKPQSFAVNLAVLKTMEQAEYSPMEVGHFALASKRYCHFTSPIRRYPDLTVHRLFTEYCRGTLKDRPPEDMSELVKLGEDCSAAARRAEAAEEEVREVLILRHLKERVGETFEGVVTGVTNFGIFIQYPKFLIDGLIRLEDLGDDWWEVNADEGKVVGEVTGQSYRVGQAVKVKIAGVDVPQRQMRLVPEKPAEGGRKRDKRKGKPGKSKGSSPKSQGGKPGKSKGSSPKSQGGKPGEGEAGPGKSGRRKKG